MIDVFIQRYDRNLLVFLCILAIVGTVMLYSASWYESFSSSNGRTEMLFLQNHLKRLLVGVFFLFGFLTIDYRKLKEIAPYLIALSIIFFQNDSFIRCNFIFRILFPSRTFLACFESFRF